MKNIKFVAFLLLLAAFNCLTKAQPWTPSGSNYYANPLTTKIGIGTSNPTEMLDVTGNILISGNLLLKNGDRKVGLTSNNSLTFIINGEDRLKLNNNGKTFLYGSLFLPNTSWITLGTDGLNPGTGRMGFLYEKNIGHGFIDFKDNIYFRVDGSGTSLTLQGDGNVAIGYPTVYALDGTQYQTLGHKLAVKGSVFAEGDILAGGATRKIGTSTAHNLSIVTGGTPRLDISSTGVITLRSNTTLAGNLTLSGNRKIGTSSANSLTLMTQNTDRVVISSGGEITLKGATTIESGGLNVTGNSVLKGDLNFSDADRKFGTTTEHALKLITNNQTRMTVMNDGRFQFEGSRFDFGGSNWYESFMSLKQDGDAKYHDYQGNGTNVKHALMIYSASNATGEDKPMSMWFGVDPVRKVGYIQSYRRSGNSRTIALNPRGGAVVVGNMGDKPYPQGSSPAYSLYVAGKMIATEVTVMEVGNWPDYVFTKDYTMQPLSEVEAFINENGHLPNIPSATEVAEKGIDLARMNALLLEKIEELTLRVIEQDKAIRELQEKTK